MSGVAAATAARQFFDNSGNPLENGTIDVYLAGTTTRTNTWEDRAQTTLNANPVPLDAAGWCSIVLDTALTYKFVIKDQLGATIKTEDNIVGAAGAAILADAIADIQAEQATAIAAIEAQEDTSVTAVQEAGADALASVASDRLRAERARDTLESETVYVELLDGRTNGLSIDTTHDDPDLEVKVLDTTTPANAFNGTLLDFMALSSITFTTPKLCLQSDGTLKYQDHNDALQSEDFSNASWTKTNMSAVTGTTGPNGTTADACTLTTTGTASSSASQNIAVLANRYHTHEFYVKQGTGAFCYIAITNNAVTSRAYFNLTTGAFATVDAGLTTRVATTFPDGTAMAAGWYRIAAYHKAASTNDTMRLGICDADNNVAVTNGVTLIATKAHHYRGVRSIGYIKTTTASKRGVPYDWTHGVRAVRFDVQVNYRGRWGNDLTNAAWTATNITPVLNATGPDNEPCSTITATANNGTIIQAVTSSGTSQNFHAWVRRKTGVGTLSMTVDNGSNWTEVTADVGTAGGDYLPVYLQGFVANPTVGFKIGTSGDEFEVALANVSATVHMPPPAPSHAIDFATSLDAFSIPLTAFPTATGNSFYADVYMHESSIGVASGLRTGIGFVGAGSIKSRVDMNPLVAGFRMEHTWHDGATNTDENFGNTDPGRVQIQARIKAADTSICCNGNVAWFNHLPGSYTFTALSFFLGQSVWLRRLVAVPESISDEGDDLRLFKLDDTDANVNSNILASAFVYKIDSIAGGNHSRIPALEVLSAQHDYCDILCVYGLQHDPGYSTEHPQRAQMRKFRLNRITETLTALTDNEVLYEPTGWSSDLGGVQGYTLVKLTNGPYKGRLLLFIMQQDTPSGTPDNRNLYLMYSDDNGTTWSALTKILDKSVFLGGVAGFVATGENGTGFQVQDGTHKGRVYIPINANNQNHYAMWTDDFTDSGDGSGSNWTRSTTPVPANSGFGNMSEPALALRPDGKLVMFMRNASSGIVGFSLSSDWGVTFSAAVQAAGDNTSAPTNCGLVQDDPDGAQYGRKGRMIVARATGTGRINQKVQSFTDDAVTLGDTYYAMQAERQAGYCPLRKPWADDNIILMMVETQPTVSSNVDTSQMLVAFRYE